jgi:hypothetical protein
LAGVLTHKERNAVSSFIQAPEDYFDAEPTFKQSYAPQSGEIFGILSQMKETFETNLSSSQKEEMANQKAYEDLKAAKEEKLLQAILRLTKQNEEFASTEEKPANPIEDLEGTKNHWRLTKNSWARPARKATNLFTKEPCEFMCLQGQTCEQDSEMFPNEEIEGVNQLRFQ